MRYNFPTLDDLDKTDIVKNFDEAYMSLEDVLYRLGDYQEIHDRLSKLMDDLNDIADDFDNGAFKLDTSYPDNRD